MSVALRGRDSLAFDFKTSRHYTPEGHLHVEQSNISKANVSPYKGSEIPRWQELGLDPQKVYQLLRDPKELEKGAETFNNKPLLNRHVPVTADEHDPDLVVGNVSNVRYEHPFLKGDLALWRREAIDDVEAKTKHQLSSAYRYRADMTPGVYEGAPYDGVMRDIVGNHVAQVKDGRAGDDVVVGDEAMNFPATITSSTGKEFKLTDRRSGDNRAEYVGDGGKKMWVTATGKAFVMGNVRAANDEDLAQDAVSSVAEAKAFGARVARDTGKDIGDLKALTSDWPEDQKKAAIEGYKALRGSANDEELGQDSKENVMTKQVLSRTAVALQGALAVYLQPKLAMDAKPVDIAGLLTTVSAKSFKKDKPKLIKAIGKAVEGKLAQDADIGDLAKALDAFKPEDVVEGKDLDPSSGLPKVETDDDMDDDDVNADADPMAKVMQFLKGKVSDEDLASISAMCAPAADADVDKEKEKETPAKDADTTDKDKEKDMAKDKDEDKVSKKEMEGAMDAALKKNTRETEDRVVKRMQGIADAKVKVIPLVGDLAMAFDSADGVFKHALEASGLDEDSLKDVHPSSFPLLVEQRIALKTAASKSRTKVDVAMDSKTNDAGGFAKRYPGAAKIEVGATS